MTLHDETETRFRTLHIDGTLLEFDPEEETFFRAETGIQDTEELRKHIIEVHDEAYKVFICETQGFQDASVSARPRVGGEPTRCNIFSVGTEVREVIHDGWPISQTIATDIEGGFWDLGHKLFKTTPETYPAKFLVGDMFDDAHLSPTTPVPSGPQPPVASVNSLTELRGHTSVIYASALFHLFDEEKQLELGKRLAALLDPRPGSIIFGSHSTMPVKGQTPESFAMMFCHSPESWTRMWEEQIFEKGQVKINTVMRETDTDVERKSALIEEGAKFYWLTWSVERL